MYPDVTSALASQTQDDLIHRADNSRRVRLARATHAPAPCGPRPERSHHLPRFGCRFRTWLAAGYL